MPTIPYIRQTWTEDSSLCNAARNNVHENGIYELSYAPAVRVYHNASQSITTSTATPLNFNSERFDQCANAADTQHDVAVNNTRLTCRYAGVYEIAGCVEWASNAAGYRQLWIRHQGATIIANQLIAPVSGNLTIQTIQTHYALAVNEYIELLVQHNIGVALNVNSSGNYSPEFSMVRVG